MLISGLGDTHLEVVKDKMSRKFGVKVVLSTPAVPYKETITVRRKAEYKHKKQTGGHGQYGHVMLELQPLPKRGRVRVRREDSSAARFPTTSSRLSRKASVRRATRACSPGSRWSTSR